MYFLLQKESIWIPVILVFVLMGCWSELDLYAPAFPHMMHALNTTESMMQMTLSLNFFGFFIAGLLCGPLADAYGRRLVILWGLLLFVLGSALCVYAPTMSWMLLGRLIQGLGVSAPVTICNAIVADIYQGPAQMKLMSRMNSAITIVMALAPICGVYITNQWGWRANFSVILMLALVSFVLLFNFVPETHEEQHRQTFSVKDLIINYKTLVQNQAFMFSTLGMCFSILPYFVWVGVMPLLFMEELKVPMNSYALYQASLVGLFSFLSLFLPTWTEGLPHKKVMGISIALSTSALFWLCWVAAVLPDNPLWITGILLVYTCGVVLPPNFLFAKAMDQLPHLRGCSAALIQAIRMLLMAIGTSISGYFYNDTCLPVSIIMLVSILLALPFMWVSFKTGFDNLNTTAPMGH